jgi:gliding motility-associated-like protein
MKKYCILLILSFLSYKEIFAKHITGGEMIYELISSTGTTRTFRITLRLFRDDGTVGGAALPTLLTIGIFNNDNGSKITGGGANNNWDVSIANGSEGEPVPVNAFPPCIISAPDLHYHMGLYTFTVTLPNNNNGYTGVYQTCCRIDNIANTTNSTGATYSCYIPGTNQGILTDNSPKYNTSISVVCQNKPFTVDFHATDLDGDSLAYSFCNAFDGGAATATNGASAFNDPSGPPYNSITYINGYSGTNPLGPTASINSSTGIISGIAPNAGKYVVCVCVTSFRNGAYVSTHRKDFILTVSDCTFSGAAIEAAAINCSSYNVIFQNLANNPAGTVFHWDFGVLSLTSDTSDIENTNYTYPDTGTFTVKLKVSLPGGSCVDSNSFIVKVFPGFYPKLAVTGQCKNTPIQFTDLSTADFGSPNAWSWNFGDIGSPANTSILKNPTHIYATSNNYNVHFVVKSSKGCSATIDTTILITDKPALTVPNDTTICIIDTLQLNAIGTGSFLWSPNYMISNINVSNPLVSPDVTTTYRVTLTDPFGCAGSDSVKIKVVSQITQFAPNDTTICKTDGVILNLVSDALDYHWTETPAGNTLSNANIKRPVATPTTLTNYHVVGSIGKCIAQNDIKIKVVPYPDAKAGPDQTICAGNSAQLTASGGSSYSWSPAAFLNNRLIYNPISQNPTANIKYTVTVTDTLGCPKPAKDTVVVFVAKIKADAGPADTSVVLNQPLLLQATGSTHYLWSPAQWLNNISVSNPVSLPQADIKYFVKVSNDAGCFDIDSIRVHLFRLDAGIYVPSGFTPNGDGNNDRFHPIIIGMRSLDLFRVYNRWGQLLYSGTDAQKGWDGTFGGKGQDAATYVWYAEGTDYQGNKIKKKGYVVLIR